MNEFFAKIKKHPFFKQKWVQFLIYLVKNFLDDNCTQKASSLTYTTLLSIVPILTLVLVILSTIPQLAQFKGQIQELIFSNMLPSTGIQVTKYLNQFANNSSNLTIIGVGILFFTTISMLVTIETAFNQIWRVQKKETTWLNLLRYWAVITLAPLILGTAFIVSSTVQSLSFLNQKIGGYGIDWAVWVQGGSIAVMIMGLVGMYWFIPRCQVRFKHALVAGIVVGIIFELLKLTFGVIVDNFTSYKAVYGAFAVLPLFLLWVYLSWNIVLLGVEISYCLTIFETKEVHPRHALFSLMDMLNVMYREHKKGNAVTEAGLRDVLGRQEMPNWYTYVSFLQDNNLITTSEKDEYVLKRSLNDYTFWDFYKNLPYPLPHAKDLKKLQNQSPWTGDWINIMARSEALLQRNFTIPMADIFDRIQPRQTPDAKDIEKANGGTGKDENVLAKGREKSGLSGGQVSDVVNEDKRIKETDKEQAYGFDGSLDFEGAQTNLNDTSAAMSVGDDFDAMSLNSLDDTLTDSQSTNANSLGRVGLSGASQSLQSELQSSHPSHHNLSANTQETTAEGIEGNFIPNQAFNQTGNNSQTNVKRHSSNDNQSAAATSSVTTRLNQKITQTVKHNVRKNLEKLGDNTAMRAKLRQLSPLGFIKKQLVKRLSKKDPTIITDKDKP